METMRS